MDQNDTELEARFDDLYQQIMAGYDSLPLATWTAEYRAARRELQSLEIQFRAIGVELARRLAERTSPTPWLIYACPCGGWLDWCDDGTAAQCEKCGTVHTSTSILVKVPDE